MASKQERLVEWLHDAQAAERQAETMLAGTARQMDHDPEFRTMLSRHSELSGDQAERLKECLLQLGEDSSVLKNIIGQITALGQSLSGYVVGDSPAKALLATTTQAAMEAASYRILVSAARDAGEQRVAEICQGLLDEEERFAEELRSQTPAIVERYLARESREELAEA